MMLKTFVAAAAVAAALIVPATAQSAAKPDGVWKDRWGTTFTFQLCGDGTQLCGTLNDIQGDSRTEENLAFVNQQVVQGEQTAPNKWEGRIALNGGKAKAIVEMTGPDTLKITGCQILCSSIDYQRVS
jgi:opacity protein-like surface antigen